MGGERERKEGKRQKWWGGGKRAGESCDGRMKVEIESLERVNGKWVKKSMKKSGEKEKEKMKVGEIA